MKQKSQCLVNNNGTYQLQVGDMIVEIKYSICNKKIDECILNILKQKIQK